MSPTHVAMVSPLVTVMVRAPTNSAARSVVLSVMIVAVTAVMASVVTLLLAEPDTVTMSPTAKVVVEVREATSLYFVDITVSIGAVTQSG